MKRANVKVIFWLIWFCIILQLQYADGQTFTRAEYFFDSDPGVNKGTAITGFTQDTLLNYTFNASAIGLAAGIHSVSVRAMDSNNLWTIVGSQMIYINPLVALQTFVSINLKLTNGEYFIDNDPGVNNGIHLYMFSGDSISQSYSVNTNNLTVGTHIIGVRIKDAGGNWSVIGSSSFTIATTACITPTAQFTYDTVNAGNVTHFKNLSTNTNTGTSYVWQITASGVTNTISSQNTTQTFLNPGIYDAKLSVSNGGTCTSVAISKVFVAPILSRNISINGKTKICNGDSVLLSAQSGTNYLWSTGQTTQSIVVKNAGTYQVSYIDAYGYYVFSNAIYIEVDPVLTTNLTISNANKGNANGSAMVNPTGGTGFTYSYKWSNGGTTQTVANLLPQSYSVTVSDGVCPVTNSFVIANDTSTLHGIIFAEYCIDSITGKHTVLPVTFNDTINVFNNITIGNLKGGFHNLYVRVKDVHGLWSSFTNLIFGVNPHDTTTTAPMPQPFHRIVRAEYFWDNSDPGGGKASPFVGLTNKDSVNQNFSITLSDTLLPGFHLLNIRVKDSIYGWNTVTSQLIQIQPPADLFPPINQTTYKLAKAEYFFDADPGVGFGNKLAIIPADTLNQTYILDASTLAQGAHNAYVRVCDLKGVWSVIQSATFTVQSTTNCTTPHVDFSFVPEAATVPVSFTNLSTLTNISTTYSWDIFNDNVIDFTTANMNYTFANNGTYPVKLTVSNGNNCVSSAIKYITVGTPYSTQVTTSRSTEFCAGDSIVLTAPQGTNYQWNNGSTSQKITIYATGLFHVFYIDQNGIAKISNDVNVKVNPQMNVVLQVDPANNGLANGSAGAIVSGGSAYAYQYLWSTNSTKQTIGGLSAGNYSVQISDGKCPVSKNFAIQNKIGTPSGIVLGQYFIDSVTIHSKPVSFMVSQQDTSNNFFQFSTVGLKKGLHTIWLRVKDIYGLYSFPSQISFSVTDSLIVVVDSSANNRIIAAEYFFDAADPGAGKAFPISGIIPTDTLNYNSTINTKGLSIGGHVINVRAKDKFTGWSISSVGYFEINNGIANPVVNSTDFPIIAAEYFIDTDPGIGQGTPVPITPSYSINETFTVDVSNLTLGNHIVAIRVKTLTGNWSVINSQTISIVSPIGCITPKADFTSNLVNFGNATTLTNTTSNVNVNTLYSWDIFNDGTIDFSTFNANYTFASPGIYKVKLTVSNGSNCVSPDIERIVVGPVAPHLISIKSSTQICQNSSIQLNAPNGTNYLWSTGDTTASIQVSIAGNYQVFYTDIYGNYAISDMMSVTVLPLMNIVPTINPANVGLSNGSIGLAVSGGNSFIYHYNWSTHDTLPSVSNLVSGTYTVNVTDGYCPVNLSLTIPANPIPTTGLTKGEYFYDTDPGLGLATKINISFGDTLNTFFNAPTTGLTSGIHYLYVRVKDNTGLWSMPTMQQIYILQPAGQPIPADTLPYIVAAEYFYNADPGVGKGTPLNVSTPSSSVNIAANLPVTGLPQGSNIVCVRVKDSKGNWNIISSSNFMLCVPPAQPLASNDTSICETKPVTLKSTTVNGATYQWYGPNGFSSTVQNPALTNTTTTQSGYYRVYAVTGGNCYSKPDSVLLTVSNNPKAAGFITGRSEACVGDSLIFFVPSILGATSYLWNFPVQYSVLAGNGTNSIAVKFTSSFTRVGVTVKGTSACGIGAASDTFAVKINSNAPGTAGTITGQSLVCQGQKNISYTVPSVTNATNYVWTLPQGLSIVSGQNASKITVNFTNNAVSGNIQVYGQNSCGGGVPSAVFPVSVKTFPAVTLKTFDNICQNASQLALANGSPSGGVYSGVGITNGIFDPSVAGSGTHTIQYKVVNVNGCADSSQALINVLPLVTSAGQISGTTDACQGATNLRFVLSPINNATSYTWTMPTGFVGTSTSNLMIASLSNSATTGLIQVAGLNSCGSGPQSSFNVNVNPTPVITQMASTQTRCGSGNLTFVAHATQGSVIQWSIDNFLNVFATGDTLTMTNVLTNTNVTASYRATNLVTGCTSNVTTVTGAASPIPLAFAGNDTSICAGTAISLYATGGTNYSWSNGVVQGIPFIPTQTATYTVTVANQFNCTATDNIVVSVKPQPIAFAGHDTITYGTNNSMLLNANPVGANSGKWTVVQGKATIVNPTSNNTVAQNLTNGANTFRWTVSNGGCSNYADVHVQYKLTNPSNAGANQNLCTDNTFMNAQPPTNGTGYWTLISGSALIANAALYNTQVTKLGMGQNIFSWSVVDSGYVYVDYVSIYNNYPMNINAGADQWVCTNSLVMSANTIFQGTGHWKALNPQIFFSDTTSNTATVYNLDFNNNVLIWTITNQSCKATDTINIFNRAPYAFAGTPQLIYDSTITQFAGHTYLTAAQPYLGTGVWSVSSGAATFASPTLIHTLASGFLLGDNTIKWTVTNECGSASDSLIITRGISYRAKLPSFNWDSIPGWSPPGIPSWNDSVTIPQGVNVVNLNIQDSIGIIQIKGNYISLNFDANIVLNKLYVTGDSATVVFNDSVFIGNIIVYAGASVKLIQSQSKKVTKIRCSSITVEPETSKLAGGKLTLSKGSSITVEPETSKGEVSGTGNIDIWDGGVFVMMDSAKVDMNIPTGKVISGSRNISIGKGAKLTMNTGSSITVEPETSKVATSNNANIYFRSGSSVTMSKGSSITVEPETSKATANSRNITIESRSKLTMQSGSSITVEPETSKGNLNPGLITVYDSASIIDYNASSGVIGNIVTYITAKKNAMQLISSPVTKSPSFFINAQIQQYVETSHLWTTVTTGAGLQVMKGYKMLPSRDTSYVFVDTIFNDGALTTGNLSYTNLFNNPYFDGWQLVGNPYPSAISWDTVGWTKTNVYNTLYTWNGTNYAVYVPNSTGMNGIGINNGSPLINAHQAFWVKVVPNGTNGSNGVGSIGINNATRVHYDDFVFAPVVQQKMVRMKVTANNLSDETAVRFTAKGDGKFDGTQDAFKMFSNTKNIPQLYSLNSNSDTLALQTLASAAVHQQKVPVNFKCDVSGQYSIQASGIIYYADSLILLHDLLTNANYDIRSATPYLFNYNVGDAVKRFELIFNAQLSGIQNISADEANATIYSYNKYVNVDITTTKFQKDARIEVYDLLGHLIAAKTNLHEGANQVYLNTVNGCYIIKVTVNNKFFVKKVIIGL